MLIKLLSTSHAICINDEEVDEREDEVDPTDNEVDDKVLIDNGVERPHAHKQLRDEGSHDIRWAGVSVREEVERRGKDPFMSKERRVGIRRKKNATWHAMSARNVYVAIMDL